MGKRDLIYKETVVIGSNEVTATISEHYGPEVSIEYFDPYLNERTLEFSGIDEIRKLKEVLEKVETAYESLMHREQGLD